MIFKNVTFYNEVFQKDVADIQVENGRITAIGVLGQEGRDMQGYTLLPDKVVNTGTGDKTVEVTPAAGAVIFPTARSAVWIGSAPPWLSAGSPPFAVPP